jgi:hypothetical protein
MRDASSRFLCMVPVQQRRVPRALGALKLVVRRPVEDVSPDGVAEECLQRRQRRIDSPFRVALLAQFLCEGDDVIRPDFRSDACRQAVARRAEPGSRCTSRSFAASGQ